LVPRALGAGLITDDHLGVTAVTGVVRLDATMDPALALQADGEPLGAVSAVSLHAEAAALRLVVPPAQR
jgi:diacylglycerol kinase family enzyme